MAQANDTFVEAVDANLESHTPTGSNPGTSWVVQVTGANIDVIGATDRIEDIGTANGNRYRMSDDLGGDEMDVQMDCTFDSDVLSGVGICGRVPSTFGQTGWEFHYDGAAGQWQLEDGTTTVTLTEAWPGGTPTMKMSTRITGQTGYVNGVQKCTTTSNTKTGNNFGGMFMLSFGGANHHSSGDNYQSQLFVAVVASTLVTGPFPTYRPDLP